MNPQTKYLLTSSIIGSLIATTIYYNALTPIIGPPSPLASYSPPSAPQASSASPKK